jgi:hypothetical protein
MYALNEYARTIRVPSNVLQDAQKQLDALQSHVNELVQLTSPSAQVVANTAKQKVQFVDVGSGWLNLNRLIESPHKNSYLWAALTLLGVLAVGAGLRIQGRKTSSALSTLTPPNKKTDIPISGKMSPLELPADIAALNLDLNAQTPQSVSEYPSQASTKTLQ